MYAFFETDVMSLPETVIVFKCYEYDLSGRNRNHEPLPTAFYDQRRLHYMVPEIRFQMITCHTVSRLQYLVKVTKLKLKVKAAMVPEMGF